MTKLSLFIASCLLLAGCSGGNSGSIQTSGVRCVAEGTAYNPIPLDLAGAQKLSVKAGDNQLPAGTYTYNGSELYYYNTDTKMQIHLAEDPNNKASRVCVRNAATQAFTDGKAAVSSFVVKADGTMDFKVRMMIFTFDGNLLNLDFKDVPTGSFKTVEDVFITKGSQMNFFKVSATDYEAHSSELNGSTRKDLVVRYKYKK